MIVIIIYFYPSTGASADYVGGTQTLIFDNTTAYSAVKIQLLDDRFCEGNEDFQVNLSTSSTGCVIADGASPITVTIEDNDIGTAGDDPHFSIVLPSGKLLCYTVQGEQGFSFNLISNRKMILNARFAPDSHRSEVTWISSIGVIVHSNTSNTTGLRFEARTRKVHVGSKKELDVSRVEKLVIRNGKLVITETMPVKETVEYPSVNVDLQDLEIAFAVKFMKEHLDIFWHRTGKMIHDSHGLIGESEA